MAKVGRDYIRRAFYRQFAELPQPKQQGIIEGLMAVMLCNADEEPSAQAELFPEDEDATEKS